MAKKKDNNNKKSKYQNAIDILNSKLGQGSVMSFEGERVKTETLKSGSMKLDGALGGGYGKGRIIEIYGQESSGKSTICIHAAVEAQKEGKLVLYIDSEHAFDPTYGENLGLNYSKDLWMFSQPDSGEDALTVAEEFLRVMDGGLIIFDSVAVMTPRAEIEGDMGDSKMGLHARMMGQGLRKLTSFISKSKVTAIFVNQIREKIGVMFGSPEITTGGNALKFYATQRLRSSILNKIKNKSEEFVGVNVKIKIVKNKIAPPFREIVLRIGFGVGFDHIQEILELGVEQEIIHKAGSWYSYGDTKLGQGELGVKEILGDNPELVKEIKEKILKNGI